MAPISFRTRANGRVRQSDTALLMGSICLSDLGVGETYIRVPDRICSMPLFSLSTM